MFNSKSQSVAVQQLPLKPDPLSVQLDDEEDEDDDDDAPCRGRSGHLSESYSESVCSDS